MDVRRSTAQILESAGRGLPVPGLAKVGVGVIALGLFVDLAVHVLTHPLHDELIGAFRLDEHLAHLVVIAGMVVVLAGIVADGIRSQRRLVRQEGSTRDAVR